MWQIPASPPVSPLPSLALLAISVEKTENILMRSSNSRSFQKSNEKSFHEQCSREGPGSHCSVYVGEGICQQRSWGGVPGVRHNDESNDHGTNDLKRSPLLSAPRGRKERRLSPSSICCSNWWLWPLGSAAASLQKPTLTTTKEHMKCPTTKSAISPLSEKISQHQPAYPRWLSSSCVTWNRKILPVSVNGKHCCFQIQNQTKHINCHSLPLNYRKDLGGGGCRLKPLKAGLAILQVGSLAGRGTKGLLNALTL